MDASTLELIVDAKAALAEGPVWDVETQRLYWVDIEGRAVHVHDPSGENDAMFDLGCRVGCLAVKESGGLLLGTENGLEYFDPANPDAGRTLLEAPEKDKPTNRFNDGKCDPVGRFFAGTMCMKKTPKAGALYAIEYVPANDAYSVRMLVSGVTTSNGLVWSRSSSTLYFIDTPTMRVDAFEYDVELGQIQGRRTVITFGDGVGRPDGMTIDAEGMLWICHWAGGRVTRWNPKNGELLDTLQIPCTNVTSCCFGGPTLEDLYITTARQGLSEEQLADEPHAGGVFKVTPGVKGIPMPRFRG